MRKDLDDLLCQRYPAIFRDRHGDKATTAMCWGFACGDGWFDLIDGLCAKIASAVDAGEMPPVKAVQVKEKMGVLCVYLSGGNNETTRLRFDVMRASETVCEECGATPAKMSALGGVYRTRCPACYSALRKEMGPHVFNFYSVEDIGPALLSHRQRVIEVFVSTFGLHLVKEKWAELEPQQAPEMVRQVRGVLGTIEAKITAKEAGK